MHRAPDTGKSTKRPTVSNDTGTPSGPHGTGAWPEGSVWGGSARGHGAHRGTPSAHGTLTRDGYERLGASPGHVTSSVDTLPARDHQGEDAHLMPDRSLRLPPLLLRERRPSPTPPRENDDVPEGGQGSSGGHGSAGGQGPTGGRGDSGGAGGSGAPDSGQRPEPPQPPADDNPFAPPPEGTPDRPWQPRRPAGGQGEGQDGRGEGDSSPWGSQWSDRQPGPAQGGRFGDRPGSNGGSGGGQNGPEGPAGGPGTGMRWDPTDPAQRRARFALLSGMWAFFFALFSWPYVALLLGALALYWAISALRSKPRARRIRTPRRRPPRAANHRPPRRSAAWSRRPWPSPWSRPPSLHSSCTATTTRA